ncbi:unnamed protein product [Discula destructiva]
MACRPQPAPGRSSAASPRKDAFVVTKLRAAGAAILGKANMSEWASLRSKEHSTGFSPRGGQTRNPFDLRKSPHGSSSGSAVAVSASLVPLSLGTETDTSIIGPASANGMVGIKPTVGLTSRAGVIPISEHMDSVGPFGRTVADAVAGLDAIVGHDPEDPFSSVTNVHQGNYLDFMATSEVLRGARFGLPTRRCWDKVPQSCKVMAQTVLDALKRAGAEILPVELPSIGERTDSTGTRNWEHGGSCQVGVDQSPKSTRPTALTATSATYLESSPVRSLEDVVRYYEESTPALKVAFLASSRRFPDGQANFIDIVEARGQQDDTYRAALAHIRKQTRDNGIEAALACETESGRNSACGPLDALLFCDRRGIGQQYAAQAGYPHHLHPDWP